MKIGILSLNPGHNYGGILQSYALQKVLERCGHKVHIIAKNHKEKEIYWGIIPKLGVRLIRKIYKNRNALIFTERYHNRITPIIFQHTFRFCKEYLNIHLIDKFSDIKTSDYDTFIVGSDQVWRPRYFEKQYKENISNAFLKFAEGWKVKRIAYAPSFGTDSWEYTSRKTKQCKELIRKFNAISVREESGIKLCNEYLGVDAIQLCDPTLLLKKEDYESLVQSAPQGNTGSLLVYCLDKSEELDSLVDKIARQKNLKPFYVNSKHGENLSVEERIKPSVESWIRGFMDADYVVTDSFHACVFSLIFHKTFVVLGNKNRGLSRFESFLKIVGLESRLLYNSLDYNEKLNEISYDDTDIIIEKLRLQSMNFLRNALNE